MVMSLSLGLLSLLGSSSIKLLIKYPGCSYGRAMIPDDANTQKPSKGLALALYKSPKKCHMLISE